MAVLDWLGFRPTISDFGSKLLMALRKAGSSGWTLDDDGLAIRHAPGLVMNLPNIFHEYLNAPSRERPAFLAKYVDGALAMSTEQVPGEWERAAQGIFVVVRSAYDYVTTEIDQRTEEAPLPPTVSRAFIGNVCLRLVYDYGTRLSHVTQSKMDLWGQPADVVFERAVSNLKSLPAPEWKLVGGGVHQLISDASYAESFMLVDEVIDELPFKDCVVIVPCNRGILLAADGSNSDHVLALIDHAMHCMQEKPWPLSSTLCTRVGGTWQVFHAAGPAAVRAHDFDLLNMASVYKDQRHALERHLEREGKDVYVAEFALARGSDGLLNWVTWTKGVPTLLARADAVAFISGHGTPHAEYFMVDWDKAVEISGHRMQPTSEYPARFFVDSFPDEAEWSYLRARARPTKARAAEAGGRA